VLALVACGVAGGGFAAIARADGDPASDYLLANQVFLSSESSSVSSSQRQLLSTVQAANHAGFAIRVAIVSSDYDLGSITALWRKPRVYARFLGLELSLSYKQRLLVVMPNGFGFNWPGHSTAAEYRVLDTTALGSGGGGLTAAAAGAVRTLASAAGVKLAVPAAPQGNVAPRGGHASDRAPAVIGAGAGAVALAAVVVLLFVRHRRRPQSGPGPASDPRTGDRSRWPVSPRWALPGFAVVCCVAAGVPILVVSELRHSSATDTTALPPVPTPYRWPAGEHRAPDFRLTDQNGRPVSLADYRGRPVIVTFVDPLCRNLCPLAAQVLNQVDRQLPAAQRPAILAVSVDIYADGRANLLEDYSKWRLVPQWRWAVGRPRQLASVWDRYQIGVSVTTKRIDGITVHYVTHDEVAFVVDGAGYERALFGWPYYPQDVESALKELSRT